MLKGKALQNKIDVWERQAIDIAGRHWKWIVLIVWLVICGWFMVEKWNDIRFFGLPDTDDNMRIMQVRGLLHGQGWYDLRDYRMNPPFGANIHWSRLVDLPIAGLILALRPFLGGAGAERWAVAIAPLLPYLLLLWSLALTARRLIDPLAYPLAILAVFFAGSTNGMFMPERIDHHGWQLALLACSLSAIADPKRLRGELVLGITSALSLAIGLEMIIYLALAGAVMVLFWVANFRGGGAASRLCRVDDRRHRARLPALRFVRQPQHRVRRAVARLSLGRASRRRADVRARLAHARGLDAAAGAGGRGGGDRRRLPCGRMAAMPTKARAYLARGATAVDELCEGGAAGLSPRLADRDADLRASGHGRHRLDRARLARGGATGSFCAGSSASPRRDSPPRSCCCGRRAPAPPRR